MNSQDIIGILEKRQAILINTHVVYTSGKHGSAYINKDAIYPDPAAVSLICQAIAEHFADSDIEVVAAPAVGGVILSQWVAHHLTSTSHRPLAVFAEKAEAGAFAFRRGYDKLLAGKRTLVVEDILTTGGTVKEVVNAVRACGGNVVGVAAICNRGGVTQQAVGDPPELFALANVTLDAWDEADCPLCARATPINVSVGKGREFLSRKK